MRTINLSSKHTDPWLRQFPDGTPEWNGWRFVFNAERDHYDYLVAYDTVHAPFVPRCPLENIIHLASEPHGLDLYSDGFLSQFAWIISQDKSIKHLGKIHNHSGLAWWIGTDPNKWPYTSWGEVGWMPEGWRPTDQDIARSMSFNELRTLSEKPKSKLLSIITSNKNQIPQHWDRIAFAHKLKVHYGDKIDHYGRGVVQMPDKLDALQDYRFHIVIENSLHDHYFTEKLADCMIAGCYPIYHGCPNLDQYFPENSYIPICIYDFNEAVDIIDYAIAHDLDKKYRAEFLRGRDDVFYKHNLFPTVVKVIEDIERGTYGSPPMPNLAEHGGKILPYDHKHFEPFVSERIRILFPMHFHWLEHSRTQPERKDPYLR